MRKAPRSRPIKTGDQLIETSDYPNAQAILAEVLTTNIIGNRGI